MVNYPPPPPSPPTEVPKSVHDLETVGGMASLNAKLFPRSFISGAKQHRFVLKNKNVPKSNKLLLLRPIQSPKIWQLITLG